MPRPWCWKVLSSEQVCGIGLLPVNVILRLLKDRLAQITILFMTDLPLHSGVQRNPMDRSCLQVCPPRS